MEPLRQDSEVKAELKARKAGWTELQPPTRPGKEAGTETGVQKHVLRPSSGTKMEAWPQARTS